MKLRESHLTSPNTNIYICVVKEIHTSKLLYVLFAHGVTVYYEQIFWNQSREKTMINNVL